MEALSVGCLVFASDIPNHQFLITNNQNGLLFKLGNYELKKQLFKFISESSKNKRNFIKCI